MISTVTRHGEISSKRVSGSASVITGHNVFIGSYKFSSISDKMRKGHKHEYSRE